MGQRDYGCPYNDRVHPEWRDLHSRALPVAPRGACGACSTPLTGAGTAPTTDRRHVRMSGSGGKPAARTSASVDSGQ